MIDSSAIVAILRAEPEADRFIAAIVAADERLIGAPTLVETFIVVSKAGPAATAMLREFIRAAGIGIAGFGESHIAVAQEAHRRFGRASGHPARLNFGDCLSYAASVVSDQPLLFKGVDFTQTDVLSAL